MERSIDNYIVVSGKNPADLQRKIQSLRQQEDWQPLGYPVVIGNEIAQAMVVYREAIGFLGWMSATQEARLQELDS